MTTAQLTVGIDTNPARQQLLELRRWMTQELNTSALQLAVKFDSRSIDDELQRYFKQRTFRISLGSANLKNIGREVAAELDNATAYVFQKTRRVKVDYDGLIRGLQTAVGAGLTGSQALTKALVPDQQVKVLVDAALLTSQVTAAITKATSHPYRIEVDGAALTLQIRSAVQAGLAGGRLGTVAAAAPTQVSKAVEASPAVRAAVGGGGDVTAVLQAVKASLEPAINELTRAAALIGGTARKIGAGTQSSSAATAKVSQSSKDAVTGVTTSYAMKVDPSEALKTIQAATAAKRLDPRTLLGLPSREEMQSASDEIKSQMQAQLSFSNLKARSAPRLDPRTLLGLPTRDEMRSSSDQIKAQMQSAADLSSLRVKSAPRIDPRALLGLPSRDEMRSASDQIKAQMQGQLDLSNLKIKSASRVDPRTLLGLPSRDEMRSASDQIKAQMQGQLDLSNLKVKSASRIDPRTLLGLPSRDEMRSASDQLKAQMQGQVDLSNLKVKSAPKLDPRTLLGLPSEAEMASASARLRAQMQADADSMAAFYERARANNAKRFAGRGTQIAAASDLAQQFGRDRAADFLGPKKAGLLDEYSELEGHARRATAAHVPLAAAMRDAHSAARGLAGSMGQMWLTWGNVAPLVAAASLGAAIRSIIMSGKELEYQLKFVSLLSGDATVSVTQFGNAINGLMVGPVEASKAMRGLAQNGLDVGQAFAALPTILRLATAGELGLTEAALGATGVMEAFGLGVGDLGRVADVFTKAAAVSNTSVAEMVEAMKQASTVSDNYRVSLEEASATLAVFAQRNIRGSAAGTAMRNMVSNLASPTEHAKAAIAALNLEIYEGSSKRLKPYTELLAELSKKLSGVNEQSKNAVLGAIFNERGFKGASPLLADFDEYLSKLKQITEESKDFTKKISEGLSETTGGKIKSLMAEFQTATSNAFFSADSAVKNFVDSLRLLVASDGFKNFLTSLTTGIVALTSALIDHGGKVALVLGVWAGFSVARVIVTGLAGLAAALVGVEAASLGTATAMRLLGTSAGIASIAVKGLLASATLGLSLIATLGLEYLFLSQKTNEADEAQKAFNNNLRLQTENLERSSDALEKEIARLQRRNELIAGGVPLSEAEKLSQGVELSSKSLDQSDARAEVDRLTAEKQRLESKTPTRLEVGRSLGDAGAAEWRQTQEELKKVNAELGKAIEKYTTVTAVKSAAERNAGLAEQARTLNESGDARAKAIKFNESLNTIQRNNPKMDLSGLQVDPIKIAAMGKEDAQKYLEAANAELGKRQRTVAVPDSKAMALARGEDLAESRKMIAGLKAEEAEMVQYMRFRKELDEAKYNPNLFGPFIAGSLAEQRAISETSTLLDMQAKHIEKLEQAKKSSTFTPADRTNIDKEIEQERARFRLAQNNLQQQKEIADAKSASRSRTEADDFNQVLSKLGVKGKENNDKVVASYSAKAAGPVEGAAIKARLAIGEDYAKASADQQLRLNTARESERILLEEKASILMRLKSMDEMAQERTGAAAEAARQQSAALRVDLAAKEAGLQAAQNDLTVQTARLTVLREQGRAAGDLAAQIAASQAEYARTAGYGWEKFWSDYEANAQSSAKLVENAMEESVGAMGETLQDYFMTGELDAKGLGTTIRSELTKAFIVKPIMDNLTGLTKLLGDQVFGMFGGIGGSGMSAANTAQAAASNQATMSLSTLTQAAYAAANALAMAGAGQGSLQVAQVGAGLFSGFGNGGGLIPGGVGAVPYAKGGVFGAIERFAKGGAFTNQIITQPTLFSFARGSKFGEMGEAGEEAVVPLKRGPGGALGIANYGGSNSSTPGPRTVILNVVNNGAPVKAKHTQRETEQGTVIDLVLDAVAGDVASGGKVHDAMQRRFGLNPGGTTPRY